MSREEVKSFIMKSLERGRFQELFEAANRELMKMVDEVFAFVFEEKFQEGGDDNSIDAYAYLDAIEA